MAGTPLREVLAVFGIRVDTGELERGQTQITAAIGSVQGLASALASTALIGGTARFVQSMIDVGSELADTSAGMGISATELTEWRHAAGMAGVDAGQLSGALTRVAVLARGNAAAFRSLGVSTRDASGELRPASDLLEDVGLAIGALPNETERTAAAVQVFGRSGRALIPLFRGTRGSITELRSEVRRLYGTDLERLAESADAAGDAEDRLSLRLDAVRTRLALLLLPAVNAILDAGVRLGETLALATRHSYALEIALALVAGAATYAAVATIGAWGPPVLIFLAAAAAVGAVILVIDDLLALMSGGESVIGDFIDELFGFGTAAEMVDRVHRSLRELAAFWTESPLAELGAFARDVGDYFSGESSPSVSADPRVTARRAAEARGLSGTAPDVARVLGVPAERGALSAPAPSSVSVSRSVTTGPIYVTGTGDPAETARRTRLEIEGVIAGDLDDSAADLVPGEG